MQFHNKRILIKLTGEALSGESSSNSIDPQQLSQTAKQLVESAQSGCQIAVVIGGGNILRGAALAKINGFDRVGADQMGMLATLINAIALKEAIKAFAHPAELLTSIEVPKIGDVFTKTKANKLLQEGNIVVLGGGTGNPYFTTDTTAILRALEIDAHYVFKATKVDGVYNKDPQKYSDAKQYETLTFAQALQENLAIMDHTAFIMCQEHNKEVFVFNFMKDGQLQQLLAGKKVGTRIHQ